MHTVHADQDTEVIARELNLAWLDEDALELVPAAGYPQMTANRRLFVERWADYHLHASVVWRGDVAEFTPDYSDVSA